MSKHPHAAQPQPTAAARPPPTRKRGQPPYVPTDKDRLTVKVMVAGGIEQVAIASVLGISGPTLRKNFRREIETAAAEIGGRVVASLINMAVGQSAAPGRSALPPNFSAAKWYTQARMGWSERIVVDDGKPADTPLRVIVEFVGDAAPSRVEHSALRSGSGLSENLRGTVQLVG
jgi:hypothetical protein